MKKILIMLLVLMNSNLNCLGQEYLSWFESLYVPGAIYNSLNSYRGDNVVVSGFCKVDSNKLNEGYSFVYLTSDGGKNWSKILEKRKLINDGNPEIFLSTSFPSINTIFVTSDSNNVYLSNDKGETWKSIKIDLSGFKTSLIKMYSDEIGIIADLDSDRLIYTKDAFINYDIITVPNSKRIVDVQLFLPDSLITLSIPLQGSDNDRSLHSSTNLGKTWEYNIGLGNLTKLNFFDFNYGIAPTKYDYASNSSLFVIYATSNNGKTWENLIERSTSYFEKIIFDFSSFAHGFSSFSYSSGIYEYYDTLKKINGHHLAGDFYFYGFGFEHIISPDANHAYISNNMLQRVFRFDRSVVSVEEPNDYRKEFSSLIANRIEIHKDFLGGNYEIFDIQGILIDQGVNQNIYSLEKIPAGLYFIKLNKDTKFKIIKLLRN